MKITLKPLHIFLLLLCAIALILLFTKLLTKEAATPKGTDSEATPYEEEYQALRYAMAERARQQFDLKNTDVLRAVQTIPRHLFVPEALRDLVYSDAALPIGFGQTISAPYMVAWMTEELELQPGERVLEIGTGSGYQAAILAELGYAEVYSMEIIPELAERAAATLNDLGYQGLRLRQSDGYFGWEEYAPFDAIIVTAAPDHLPAPLVQQLAEGGRMLIPIGPTGGYQTMWKFCKEGGQIKAYNLGGVAFVPLVSVGEPRPLQIPTPD